VQALEISEGLAMDVEMNSSAEQFYQELVTTEILTMNLDYILNYPGWD